MIAVINGGKITVKQKTQDKGNGVSRQRNQYGLFNRYRSLDASAFI
jgi:hypothetical protein